LLASGRSGAGDFRSPRIRLLDDRIHAGAEISIGDTTVVFSAVLEPTMTAEGQLRLDLQKAYVGKLPFPLRTLLDWIAPHVKLSGSDMRLDLTGPTPQLTVNISGDAPRSPIVKSVTYTEGKITVEFQAPNLNKDSGQPAERVSNHKAEKTQR
jgi:hypothetical protein